jgi:hypothetical protein
MTEAGWTLHPPLDNDTAPLGDLDSRRDLRKSFRRIDENAGNCVAVVKNAGEHPFARATREIDKIERHGSEIVKATAACQAGSSRFWSDSVRIEQPIRNFLEPAESGSFCNVASGKRPVCTAG